LDDEETPVNILLDPYLFGKGFEGSEEFLYGDGVAFGSQYPALWVSDPNGWDGPRAFYLEGDFVWFAKDTKDKVSPVEGVFNLGVSGEPGKSKHLIPMDAASSACELLPYCSPYTIAEMPAFISSLKQFSQGVMVT
jgi:hypothetical protein